MGGKPKPKLKHSVAESYLHPKRLGLLHAHEFARHCINDSIPFALLPADDGWQVMAPPRAMKQIVKLIQQITKD